MDCVSLKRFIEPDSQLSQLHFLMKTKARRGERSALFYNAERFFDLHEKRTLSTLLANRTDSLENAVSRGLVRLGFMIIIGGAGVLAKSALGFCSIPVLVYLLWGEGRRVRRTYLLDRSLREYVRMLKSTRQKRREVFVREMVEKAPLIAECGLS